MPLAFPRPRPVPRPTVRPLAPNDPIAALFPPGVPRWDWDAMRLDGLYLDTAMTQPLSALGSNVAALGSPVAAIRDQWGGPALVQAVGTKRALFGRRPPQIRQLLANSAFVGAVSGSPGTAPTGWTWQSSTGTLVAPGDGTLTFSATAARHMLSVTPSVAANDTKTFSARVVSNPNGLVFNQLILATSLPAGTTTQPRANGTLITESSYVPQPGDILSTTLTTASTAGTANLRLGVGCSSTATGSATLSEPQWENGSSRTTYQRSAGIHDITEAGQPDIWGLRFDGTDDAYASASPIALGTDEVCVLASVYKLSDAAGGIVVELSVNASANNGAFYLSAPESASANYAFLSKGTSYAIGQAFPNYAAPHAAIMTGQGKIASDLVTLRLNGAQVASAATDQGTGTYTSRTLYIGGRAGTSAFFNGWFDRLTIGASLPAAAALQRAERYLGARSRITVS